MVPLVTSTPLPIFFNSFVKHIILIFFASTIGCKSQNNDSQIFENFNTFEFIEISGNPPKEQLSKTSLKIDSIKCWLKWNGKYLNGSAKIYLEKNSNGSMQFILHDTDVVINSVEVNGDSVVVSKSPFKIKLPDNTSFLDIKFAIKSHSTKQKNAYFISGNPLFILSPSPILTTPLLKTPFSCRLYKSQEWSVRGQVTGSPSQKSLSWKSPYQFIELLFFKGEEIIIDLPNHKIIGISDSPKENTLKLLHRVQSFNDKLNIIIPLGYKERYYLFSGKKQKTYHSYRTNLTILRKDFTFEDLISSELEHVLPALAGTKSSQVRTGAIKGATCHIAGVLNKKNGIECLKKSNKLYRDLFIPVTSLEKREKFHETFSHKISKWILIFSGLIQRGRPKSLFSYDFVKRFQQNGKIVETIMGLFKIASLKPLPPNFNSLLSKRGVIIGRVSSLILKKEYSIVKITNKGSCSWNIPILYKTHHGDLSTIIQLPAPGKTESYRLHKKGKPINIVLDPLQITLMLPFGWTKEGPPTQNSTNISTTPPTLITK
jgi:hypothetical protein